jgi:N-acylneuraminate cytidylyltransferase
MAERIVAFIFARGGSKGLPRKNVLPLAGKPLIAHAIAAARATGVIDRVIVSTDDDEIRRVALDWGAEAPFRRPAELARDDSPEFLAWRHAVDTLEEMEGRLPEIFLSVPTTAPLRRPEDILACIERLRLGDCDIAITATPAARSPWFNMVVVNAAGLAEPAIAPQGKLVRRQDAPRCFDVTTVCYATTPSYIRSAAGVFAGRVGVVEVPKARAIDIDDAVDFRIAEALWSLR